MGDGLGFDIRSFSPAGHEKLIEVKTTRRGLHWPMIVSRNEIQVSHVESEKFHLYRLFDFDTPRVGMYTLRGDISDACHLIPASFEALPSATA